MCRASNGSGARCSRPPSSRASFSSSSSPSTCSSGTSVVCPLSARSPRTVLTHSTIPPSSRSATGPKVVRLDRCRAVPVDARRAHLVVRHQRAVGVFGGVLWVRDPHPSLSPLSHLSHTSLSPPSHLCPLRYKKDAIEFPVITSNIPRQIPTQVRRTLSEPSFSNQLLSSYFILSFGIHSHPHPHPRPCGISRGICRRC